MRKEREYKEKILEMEIPRYSDDRSDKMRSLILASNIRMLDILDQGNSVAIETCRQSFRTLTAICYGSLIMMNEGLKVILYTHRDKYSILLRKQLFKEIIELNGGNPEIIDKLLICNLSKMKLRRLDLINKVGLIIYEDIWQYSKAYRQIDLKTASKVQSVISSCDITDLRKRTGFNYFEQIRYRWNEDPKVSTGETRSIEWFDYMNRVMFDNYKAIRKEILLEHNPTNTPITKEEITLKNEKI